MYRASRFRLQIASLVALVALAACRSQVLNPFTPDAQSIGPAGGRVAAASGASVTIPARALAKPTTIAVQVAPASGMPTLPPLVEPGGDIVALTPHGTTFAAPVTVRIPFTPRATGPAPRLFTALPDGAWLPVDGARVGVGVVEADVTHFSFFVVGFETPGQVIPERQNRKMDMLFMVDNSLSMQPLQQKLLANFPAFIQTLQALPGGLPDLHIGVVSSDLGAGQPTGSIQHCAMGGDRGVLQPAVRPPPPPPPSPPPADAGPPVEAGTPATPTCPAVRGSFIAAGGDGSSTNYDGTIEDAFACMANLGDQGCGFEHQLESVAVALGARGAAPPENAGFLRPDALLAIVLITNEDDCSAPPDTQLFDPGSRYLSDAHGPLTSYRCNEFGHLCAGKRPPLTPADPSGASVTLADCHSAEDGVLYRVSDYVQLFKGLKADPGQVFLSVITGPAAPYQVDWAPSQQGDPDPLWPAIAHSCVESTEEFADPAVRIADLVAGFGSNAALYDICSDSFAPALTQIGATLGSAMVSGCLPPTLVDTSTNPPGLASNCSVRESYPTTGGMRAENLLPACGAATTGDRCWTLEMSSECGSGVRLRVLTPDPPAGAVLVVRCTP